MSKKFIAVLCWLACLGGGGVFAQSNTLTVQELLDSCEHALGLGEGRTPVRPGWYCVGLVDGVVVGLNLHCQSKSYGNAPEQSLLIGDVPSTGAAMQAFVNWARNNPGQWDMSPNFAMMTALTSAFPCRR